jgi:tetratricopeptide (TPR) repeat protein
MIKLTDFMREFEEEDVVGIEKYPDDVVEMERVINGDYTNITNKYAMMMAGVCVSKNIHSTEQTNGLSAKEYYEKACEMGSANAHSLLGILYENENNLELAEKHHKKALEMYDITRGHTLLGVYHYNCKQYDEAITNLLIGLQERETYTGLFILANIYASRQDYENAVKYGQLCENHHVFTRDRHRLNVIMGVSHHELKNYTNALKYFLQIEPTQNALLASCYDKIGEFEKSYQYAELDYNESGNHRKSLLWLLVYAMKLGYDEKVKRWFDIIVEINDMEIITNLQNTIKHNDPMFLFKLKTIVDKQKLYEIVKDIQTDDNVLKSVIESFHTYNWISMVTKN